jgi:hypothetical protein
MAMPKEPVQKPITDVWSEPTNGLSGRLLIQREELNPGLRHTVYLELRNKSLSPLAVTNQPQINSEVFDSAGKSLGASDFPMSGPIQNPQWAVIPRDACICLRIDMQTVGVPTREHGMTLLAVGGRSWGIRAGEYVIKATLVCQKQEGAPQNQWVGELELPPVKVAVTTSGVDPR